MSYESISVLRASTTVAKARELIELLDYLPVRDGLKVPNRVGCYLWYDNNDYRSWSGVELDIYKTSRGPVKVTTRSTISRSYWDLLHQNRTLKLLRDLFGGHFHTDAGRNRYWRPQSPAPSPLSSGCYLARWHFHNSIMRADVYLRSRTLSGNLGAENPSGLPYVDELNPRLLSNNLLVPFMLAVWEEYFRSTFTACLRYSSQRAAALKRAKLSHADLEKIAIGASFVERTVAETFPFQRPSSISDAFRLIDPNLDLGAAMRKRYRGRSTSLYDSIEKLVELRNAMVHSGKMDLALFDRQILSIKNDLVVAIDRSYDSVARNYRFTPIRGF